MAGRKRDIPIMVRLTRQEKELIQQKMQELGTTNMEAYFRKMAIDGYVIHLDLSDVRELITLLRRYSNNLNQLTKRAHETGNIYAVDLEDLFQKHQHTENNLLNYDALNEKAAEVISRFHALSVQIKAAEKRMAEIAVLRTHIINYSKTRDVYVSYRKSGYSKKFYEEHTADLLLHKTAKEAFDALGANKVPTVKSLNMEYAELLSAKKKAFTEYTNARAEMREVLTVKANVERILEYNNDIDDNRFRLNL